MTSRFVVEGIALIALLFVGSWMAAVAQMRRSGIRSSMAFLGLAAAMVTVAGPYILAQLAWWSFSLALLPWTLLGLVPAWAVIVWLRFHHPNRT
jgi:hypothetical protein